jgi:hypothetical protein
LIDEQSESWGRGPDGCAGGENGVVIDRLREQATVSSERAGDSIADQTL